MQATQINSTEWQVTDGNGGEHRVFMPSGAVEADVLAAFAEAQNPLPPTAQQLAADRVIAVKAETTRRIDAVADPYARENMIGAAAAGVLTAAQQTTYAASVQWIADMRAACQALIADPQADFTDDANWPAAPADVVALAAQF